VPQDRFDPAAPAATNAAMSAPGPTSHTYFSQRLRLHYVDWGNPGQPPLLLIHGGRDHCRNWDWAAAALRDRWHVLAPDLRGHGDSQWSPDGSYTMAGYIYDLAQLIHQQHLAPLTIIAHSLGGNIALRYAGIYPESVLRLVAIEGLGPSPRMVAERSPQNIAERMDQWIREQRGLAGRLPRRYPSIEDAFRRMQEENPHLSAGQARHLTEHGVNQNEDGTYSWKFDNYVRAWPPYDMRGRDIELLWSRIACPTLLLYGTESRSGNPAEDGRAAPFRHATIIGIERAGHWLHHDRLDAFLTIVRQFLEG
jgi:pimeloyl-ACP methyl ester carboxylesterase